MAPYAFRGRFVRFIRIGKLPGYHFFMAFSAGVIRSADREGISLDQLEVRLQSGALRWGLTVELASANELEYVFEVEAAERG